MIYTFAPDFVYWRQVVDHKKLKEELYPKIMESEDSLYRPWDSCNAKSSMSKKDLNEKVFTREVLKKILWEPFDEFMSEFSSSYKLPLGVPSNSKVDSWYNLYYDNDYQESHNHVQPSYTYGANEYHTLYAAIYILHQTGPSKTVFRKTSNTPGTWTGDTVSYDTSKIENIKEGSIIIFPTYLDHYVLPATGNRITLSFNISSTFP